MLYPLSYRPAQGDSPSILPQNPVVVVKVVRRAGVVRASVKDQ
ncbi:hypothetical protein [Rubrobacter indicoceani]|nr:hypothetical protein [Rubrobacter indicoceani]